jgi:hypothetical protein
MKHVYHAQQTKAITRRQMFEPHRKNGEPKRQTEPAGVPLHPAAEKPFNNYLVVNHLRQCRHQYDPLCFKFETIIAYIGQRVKRRLLLGYNNFLSITRRAASQPIISKTIDY